MQQVKRLLVVLVMIIPMLGCGKSNKVVIKELTPEQIAEQEASLKEVGSSEADHKKNMPKEKSHEQTVEDAERAHQRQQRR